jgi:hypothetical protein
MTAQVMPIKEIPAVEQDQSDLVPLEIDALAIVGGGEGMISIG